MPRSRSRPLRFRPQANPVEDLTSRLGEVLFGSPLPLMASLSHCRSLTTRRGKEPRQDACQVLDPETAGEQAPSPSQIRPGELALCNAVLPERTALSRSSFPLMFSGVSCYSQSLFSERMSKVASTGASWSRHERGLESRWLTPGHELRLQRQRGAGGVGCFE